MVDRLVVLDKCANGELTNYHTLITTMFDDMGILYETLKPIVDQITVDAITFFPATSGVSFILTKNVPIEKKMINSRTKVSVKTSGKTTTVNIPINAK